LPLRLRRLKRVTTSKARVGEIRKRPGLIQAKWPFERI
jgi:hypothetical protein